MADTQSGFLDPTRNLGFIDGRRRAQSDEELEGKPYSYTFLGRDSI